MVAARGVWGDLFSHDKGVVKGVKKAMLLMALVEVFNFPVTVEVMYGNDLDTSVYGSGFPRVTDQKPKSIDDKLWEEYSTNPWNLNNLPKLKGSMLRAVHHNITGVMVPWLYIGMLFSSFCWHFEDHCFYSMNYLPLFSVFSLCIFLAFYLFISLILVFERG